MVSELCSKLSEPGPRKPAAGSCFIVTMQHQTLHQRDIHPANRHYCCIHVSEFSAALEGCKKTGKNVRTFLTEGQPHSSRSHIYTGFLGICCSNKKKVSKMKTKIVYGRRLLIFAFDENRCLCLDVYHQRWLTSYQWLDSLKHKTSTRA